MQSRYGYIFIIQNLDIKSSTTEDNGFFDRLYIGGRFYKFTSINKSSLSVKCEDEKILLKGYNSRGLYKNKAIRN